MKAPIDAVAATPVQIPPLGLTAESAPFDKEVWPLDEQGGTPPCISPTSGKVWLIGAGPGDVELLTLKAVRALGEADVALVDELVNREVLQFLKPGTRVVEVSKRGGCTSTPQDFIERQMLRYARQGLTVARIKGGDPYVFGRGGEEADTLRQAGVAVEVVNGITSGIAAPASLGIPVTHRDCSRGVTLVTGHTSRENARGKGPNWEALAQSGTTLVIYMGMAHLAEIAAALRAAGMRGDTPVALIQNGTLATERSVVTSLAGASEAARTSGIRSPAIIVVGDVVRFATQAVAQASEAPRQVAQG
jgi:uroporphyrin-III C-methyltransferase